MIKEIILIHACQKAEKRRITSKTKKLNTSIPVPEVETQNLLQFTAEGKSERLAWLKLLKR